MRWSLILGPLVGLSIGLVGACSSNIEPSVLDRFTATDVPERGPSEATRPTSRNWTPPALIPTTLPGRQLAQHPFLYAGEGSNMIYVVRDGKVVWTYYAGKGGEIDDLWMLSNGNILYTRMLMVEEVTPEKQVVWHYDCPPGTQCHSVQPVGLDKVLVTQNGLPPKLLRIDIHTGKIEWEHPLPTTDPTNAKGVHTQFRHVRLTKEGTWLVPCLSMNKVIEYDADWNPIFTVAIKSPWAALRLPNGDILVSGDHYGVLAEFNRKGETVWQVTTHDLPNAELRVVQGVQVLAKGDRVICSSPGSPSRGNKTQAIQAVEITPDKKVVWILQDWQDLSGASSIQLLDEPGRAENLELLR